MRREVIIPAVLNGIMLLMISIEAAALLLDPTGGWMDMGDGLYEIQQIPQLAQIPLLFDNYIPYAIGLILFVALPNFLALKIITSRPVKSMHRTLMAGLILASWMTFDCFVMSGNKMAYVFMAIGILQVGCSAHAIRSLKRQVSKDHKEK